MAHARDMLEQARQDAENHAREAEEATLEARSLKEELEENREEICAREATTKGLEEAVKVCPVSWCRCRYHLCRFQLPSLLLQGLAKFQPRSPSGREPVRRLASRVEERTRPLPSLNTECFGKRGSMYRSVVYLMSPQPLPFQLDSAFQGMLGVNVWDGNTQAEHVVPFTVCSTESVCNHSAKQIWKCWVYPLLAGLSCCRVYQLE